MKKYLTKPCSHCPFRNDIPPYLNNLRAQEIWESLTDRGAMFPCHETTGAKGPKKGPELFCAGALILLEREGLAHKNQMVRISERLGMLARREELDLENAPVYETAEEWIEAQPRR